MEVGTAPTMELRGQAEPKISEDRFTDSQASLKNAREIIACGLKHHNTFINTAL
jgi:hypothetical protein